MHGDAVSMHKMQAAARRPMQECTANLQSGQIGDTRPAIKSKKPGETFPGLCTKQMLDLNS